MKKLLTIKHWQLFLLMFGSIFICQIVISFIAFTTHDPTAILKFFPVIMIFFLAIFFGWFYTLGSGLHTLLPESVEMNLKKFKIALIFPAIYILAISFFIYYSASSPEQPDPSMLFAFIILPHLLSICCIFYCLYFCAKALKSIEWQRPVTFSDFAGEFFLLWFFPIGVWFIQPRLNKLFEPKADNPNLFNSYME